MVEVPSINEMLYGGKTTCVYVMEAEGLHIVKVGTSDRPLNRCNQMQTGSHNNLVLYWIGRVPEGMGHKVEKAAHAILKKAKMHHRGEWFNCSAAYARGAILSAGESLGVSVKEDLYYSIGYRERA